VIVLITGDRGWKDKTAVDTVIAGLRHLQKPLTVLHGHAKGADALAHEWRACADVDVRSFPADWTRFGNGAGPIRNRQMLDEEPDLVVAFHDDLVHSKGTGDCVAEALRRGIPVWHFQHPA